jgi:hypothetical protein
VFRRLEEENWDDSLAEPDYVGAITVLDEETVQCRLFQRNHFGRFIESRVDCGTGRASCVK